MQHFLTDPNSKLKWWC